MDPPRVFGLLSIGVGVVEPGRLAHPPVHEEELLLEAYPANREAHAPHICAIALRPLLWEGSVRPRGTINIWGVCEHLRLGPFSSPYVNHICQPRDALLRRGECRPVHVRGHASACRSSVGEARVGFVVRRGRLLLEALQQPLQIVQEYVGGVPAVTVPDYHPQRYEIFPVLGERVSGHLPAALAHPARDVEGRIPFHLVPKLESEDGELATVGYELEGTELRDSAGDVGSHVPALLLHAPVALETEPEEVVVLSHDLRARAREVQRKRGHISPEVVHPEDEILRQGI